MSQNSHMTITEFLEARIAEDEGFIELRGPYPHSMHSSDTAGTFSPKCPDCLGLQGKARVLAECAAKRAIIGEHQRYEEVQHMVYGDIYPCTECGSVDDSPVQWPCRTLEAIASVYADHPDYRQEWAL